ncbi:MAG: hypothetical protein NUV70_07440 [Caldiserica bacterium]|nr:hypothetical protein [Caldisericota bacterium]
MKREVIKGLVVVVLVFLMTMGLFPGVVPSGAYSGEEYSIPEPPSFEFIDKIIYEGMDMPPGPDAQPSWTIYGIDLTQGIRGNTTLGSGPNFTAGVYTSNYYKGTFASLLARKPGITFSSDDAAGAWVGGDFSSHMNFIQTGWIYLQRGGPYAFVQYCVNGSYSPVYTYDLLSPDTYYSFRIYYYSPTSSWVCQIYISGAWKTLKSVSIGVSSISSMSYGEARSSDGYHSGMLPKSMNLYGEIHDGTSWQSWDTRFATSEDHQDRPEVDMVVRNPYYNIEYWGQ